MKRSLAMNMIMRLLFVFIMIIHCAYASNPLDNVLLIINYNHARFKNICLYNSIPLLKKIYGPYFKNIVFYGPKEGPSRNGRLYLGHGVSSISPNTPNLHHYEHFRGYFSYMCIADAMTRYPNHDGYFFLHDDCLLNAWLLDNLDTTKVWQPQWRFMNSDVGEPIDLTLGNQAFPGWSWWSRRWGYKAMQKAFNDLPYHAQKILEKNWGPNHVVAGYSDIVYIPAQYKDSFIELAIIFGGHKAFLETALPTIVSCLCPKAEWQWMNGYNAYSIQDYKLDVYFNHPIKLSKEGNKVFVAEIFQKMAHYRGA